MATFKEEIKDIVLNRIGQTPVIKLRNFSPETGACIWAKMECLNPGGSVKSRTAFWMVNQAIQRGEIMKDTILVEATSGNQGIGISMVGAALGLKVKIVMPENMSQERQMMMKAYGAEVLLTPAGNDIGEAIENAVKKAHELRDSDPKVFLVDQFCNPDNPDAHRLFTAQEIIEQIPGPVDAFVSGIGTGGTITGVGEVLKEKYPDCLIVAVEPENAAILKGGKIGHHIQQGIGDGLIPDVLNCDIIDRIILVSDEEALKASRILAKKEGLFVGVSSGTNLVGACAMAKELGKGKTIVTLLPDNGERYLSSGLIEEGEEDC